VVPTQAPAPTAIPTKPPAPTPKPADPQPAQPAQTQQAQPTAVPTVAAPITTTQAVSGGVVCNVFVRTGLLIRETPARNAKSLGVILRTEAFTATGRTASGVYVLGINTKGIQGWVLGGGLRCQTPVRRLAVISVQAAPARPVPTPTPSS
ncbi:MAG: hypothetical protein HC853_05705, partial [Anaerolineae bacterium]|nr:hypothetical protein [Anaerolineae bacterium]